MDSFKLLYETIMTTIIISDLFISSTHLAVQSNFMEVVLCDAMISLVNFFSFDEAKEMSQLFWTFEPISLKLNSLSRRVDFLGVDFS